MLLVQNHLLNLRRYLGCMNYMRRHVKDAAILMKPLSSQVNVPITEWPLEDMRIAFEKMQDAMKEQLHLGHLNYGQTIVVSADASVLGVGGCIGVDSDGELVNRVMACVAHAFTAAEAKWKSIEQVAFAWIYTILYFRVVLLGHPSFWRQILYPWGDISEGNALVNGYAKFCLCFITCSRGRGVDT